MKRGLEPIGKHILLREIYEQPRAIRETIELESNEVNRVANRFRKRPIHYLGMGSSYFASIYAKYLHEQLTHSRAETHLASEFVHYPSSIMPGEITVALSQSGESIETVRAAQLLKRKRRLVIGVTNEPRSTLAKLSDCLLLTHAGRERAGATKTFVSTLALLYFLLGEVAFRSKRLGERKKNSLSQEILRMAGRIDEKLDSWNDDAKAHAIRLADSHTAMVLARGPNLPGALQGALLFKEVARIPAEGMSSGEFSHGPIEAVSREMSVVILGGGRTSELQYQLALRSKANHASVLMLTPTEVRKIDSMCFGQTDETLTIFPCTTLLELLAYHCAIRKGLNPDQLNHAQKVTIRE